MKKSISVCLIALSLASNAWAKPQHNLSDIKKQIIAYHKTTGYQHDTNIQGAKAKRTLVRLFKKWRRGPKNKKPALVLDIDETAVSNFPYLKSIGFGYNKTMEREMCQQTFPKAIPSILSLYKFAKKKDIAVFFITGRNRKFHRSTIRTLHAAGYQHWTRLYDRTTPTMTATAFKTQIRKKIERHGYRILLSVGDQWSDLNGGHTQATVKLPNYIYFIP